MSYFKNFPYIAYPLGNKKEVVTDILRRSSFPEKIKGNAALYNEYIITEGETPESVANDFYGSVFLYWIILLFNEIHDASFDWPLNSHELLDFCINTYGEEGMNDVRYYEKNGIIIGEYKEFNYSDENFVWFSPTHPNRKDESILPVTHYEHEERSNEKRRNIKILRSELVPEVIKQFKESLK